MTELNKITLPIYKPGYGMSPASAGPASGMRFDIDNPYNSDFFGFGVKGLFPVNPPTFGASFGKKRRHRKKAKKSKGKAKKKSKKN